jgi:hypothetical protein
MISPLFCQNTAFKMTVFSPASHADGQFLLRIEKMRIFAADTIKGCPEG